MEKINRFIQQFKYVVLFLAQPFLCLVFLESDLEEIAGNKMSGFHSEVEPTL